MRSRFDKWWPWLKALCAIAIVAAVSWRFVRDLQHPELWQRSFHFGWLALSGVLYVLSLGFSILFWYRLLRSLGQRPNILAAIRAYYVGLQGKYLPGKAWALVIRANLVRGPEVRLGVALFTSFYEVFTTMASGVLLSAILFAFLWPSNPTTERWPILRHLLSGQESEIPVADRKGLVLTDLMLLAIVGIPLLPGIFNRIVQRLASFQSAARVEGENRPALPHLKPWSLPEGLILTSGAWFLMGASLWATLRGILDQPEPWSWELWGRYTASVGLAYVAGFLIFFVPSGIGVREFFLKVVLTSELAGMLGSRSAEAGPTAALAVLVLRLAWTATEVLTAGLVYWLPGPKMQPRMKHGSNTD
ncbi:MAG: flippase-like domain-containing protein [Planctomycetes bacterium]|nr:flippase-like domain-containing protein [Planctomycetota bacterium]